MPPVPIAVVEHVRDGRARRYAFAEQYVTVLQRVLVKISSGARSARKD